MSDIRFSGIVEEDMTDLDEEVFVRAGERVYGNLNYYGETPYIFGEIEDVDPEYVAPAFWVPVLPESIEAEIFGVKIPFARLRELAAAEREGRVVVLPVAVDELAYTPDGDAIVKNWDITARVTFCVPHRSGIYWSDKYSVFILLIRSQVVNCVLVY